MNAKTRARVESAIERLGYRPNAFARGLMLRRSEIVGLVLPDLHGEFYSEIIRGADAQARAMGYNLVVSSARDVDDSHSLLHAIRQRSLLDGVVVMVSELTDRVQEALAGLRLPFVVLDREIDGTPHDSVVIDQRHGAVALMRHLIERCGARRVFFVGGQQTNIDTIARLEAYRQVLYEAGLPADPGDVHHLDYQYDTAYELAARHIREWAGPGEARQEAGPRDARNGAGRAVFAANDEMAAGIVAAAVEAGVAVPQNLAVVGFDDTRIARMTRPPLTTVRVPMSRMGAKAIELLCLRVADPARPPESVSLAPELIVRESCGDKARR